jgi:hypothetical protein
VQKYYLDLIIQELFYYTNAGLLTLLAVKRPPSNIRRHTMSLFEIKCPLCKGTLWVDQSSGKVVDHKSADHQKTDFNDFVKQQKEKSSQWEGKIKKAAEDTAKRKAEIEEKFKVAKEKPEEIQGDYESPFKWD